MQQKEGGSVLAWIMIRLPGNILTGRGEREMMMFTAKSFGNLCRAYALIILYVSVQGCATSKSSTENAEKGQGWVKQSPLNYRDHKATDSVSIVPGERYRAGKLKQWLAGAHYRQTWTAPVTVPVIDITTEKGGLRPLKAGGNMQSLTLHLEAADGKRYVLRSVQKNPIRTLPEELRKTFVVHVAQDQVSTLHPYGALAAASLAEAAGIYHTNPKLVYVPATPALGEFERSHGGMLAILEEKPGGDWSDQALFGSSANIVDTDEVIAKMRSDITHRVDERAFARARLLDILVGDWDRSEDQWAWASFTSDSLTIYKPIPRDRDQAFVMMDGFFPWLFSRKWAARKYQGFSEEVQDMKGLNYNGRWIDRSFLTSLTMQDWRSIADSLKASITDEVIDLP
jgi:hypothetical protein